MSSSSSSSSKSEPLLISGILDNAQIPHQPLVVIDDRPTFGGIPLFREMVQRSLDKSESSVLVTTLHTLETFLPSPSSGSNMKFIDLTGEIPGYGSETTIADIESRILSSYTSGVQIFIDSLDIIAEDYTPSATLRLIRSLLSTLKKSKAPSRLIILISPNSSLYPTLTSAQFSATLTHLIPHPPALVTHLSKQYLAPISQIPSGNLWMILVNASKRKRGEEMSFTVQDGLDFDPFWNNHTSSSSSSSSKSSNVGVGAGGGGAVLQILVRKAVGGVKGISRSLEGVKLSSTPIRLSIIPLDRLVPLNPITATSASQAPSRASTHAELDLPFNLNLTDSQRKQRGAVPLPYAHEGEGASGDLIWEDEEETDDEEI